MTGSLIKKGVRLLQATTKILVTHEPQCENWINTKNRREDFTVWIFRRNEVICGNATGNLLQPVVAR